MCQPVGHDVRGSAVIETDFKDINGLVELSLVGPMAPVAWWSFSNWNAGRPTANSLLPLGQQKFGDMNAGSRTQRENRLCVGVSDRKCYAVATFTMSGICRTPVNACQSSCSQIYSGGTFKAEIHGTAFYAGNVYHGLG